MSEHVSLDERFKVRAPRHTLEAEEIPQVAAAVGRILLHSAGLYEDLVTRDPVGIAAHTVAIYDELSRIKRELED